MNCIDCEGKIERGVMPFLIDRNGYHLTLDAVPAWVCSQCGEVYFDETDVDAIQALIQAVDQKTVDLAVPA